MPAGAGVDGGGARRPRAALRGARRAIERIDRDVGAALERMVRRHHARRLRRLGWEAALAAPRGGWAEGAPPPRPGNSLEVLIDGAAAFDAMASAIAAARSHVHIAAWHLAPAFALRRGRDRLRLVDVLAETSLRAEVRVLLWSGTPVPPFRPWRWDAERARIALRRAGVRCVIDSSDHPTGSLHEKLLVVDDRIAFVNSIEPTDLQGDRYDERAHRPRGSAGWHDLATRLEGPAVADVAEHFAMRWSEVTGEQLPRSATPAPAGDTEVQVVRTVPERRYRPVERGDFRLLESLLRGLGSARRLVYIETQYLWSTEVVALLADRLRNPPTDGFRVLLVLPRRPQMAVDDTQGQLAVLTDADAGAGRLLACTLVAHGPARSHPVYVHAKVAIVDDRWLCVGSANLNDLSLFNATEVNAVTWDAALARATRERLWAEHLESSCDDVRGDPTGVIDGRWKPIATDQLRRLRRGQRPTRRIVALPAASRRSRRVLGPLQNVTLGA